MATVVAGEKALMAAIDAGATDVELAKGELTLRATLVVERALRLRGQRGSVLLGPKVGPAIEVKANLTLEELTIRSSAEGPSVRVSNGETRLLRCKLVGAGRVRGMAGTLELMQAEIERASRRGKKQKQEPPPAQTVGILACSSARVVLVECELSNHPEAGLRTTDSAAVEVEASRFMANRMGLMHESTGSLKIVRSRFEDNAALGAEVLAGDAEITDSEASSNISPGFGVGGEARARLLRNRATDNKYAGIRVTGGEATLEENVCSGHEIAGIGVFDGRAILRRNHCHGPARCRSPNGRG